jgi:hypothetical protein
MSKLSFNITGIYKVSEDSLISMATAPQPIITINSNGTYNDYFKFDTIKNSTEWNSNTAPWVVTCTNGGSFTIKCDINNNNQGEAYFVISYNLEGILDNLHMTVSGNGTMKAQRNFNSGDQIRIQTSNLAGPGPANASCTLYIYEGLVANQL